MFRALSVRLVLGVGLSLLYAFHKRQIKLVFKKRGFCSSQTKQNSLQLTARRHKTWQIKADLFIGKGGHSHERAPEAHSSGGSGEHPSPQNPAFLENIVCVDISIMSLVAVFVKIIG